MIDGVLRATLGGLSLAVVLANAALAANSSSFPTTHTSLAAASGGISRLVVAQIVPIVVTPYRWTARKAADGSILISGYQPEASTQSELLAVAGAKALDASSIASGAPSGFVGDAETGIRILSQLDEGVVDLTGTSWSVSGRIKSEAAARALQLLIDSGKLEGKGWTLDLKMPEASVAEAPSSEPAGVVTTLDPDAPISVETQLPEVAVEESASTEVIDTMSGETSEAATIAEEVAEPVSEDAMVALDDEDQVSPATSVAFSFAALKTGEDWLLGGDAPITAFQRLVDIHLGVTTGGRLAVVPAPEGFGAAALGALDLLAELDKGRVLFDGDIWKISGSVSSETVASEIEKAAKEQGLVASISIVDSSPVEPENTVPDRADFASLGLSTEPTTPIEKSEVADRADFASLGLSTEPTNPMPETDTPERVEFADLGLSTAPPQPSKPAPIPLPTIIPYVWQAELREGGTLDISGNVPSDSLRRFLDVRAAGGRNNTILASGAPEGFAEGILAGLNALQQLDIGRLDYDGATWSLTGSAADAAAKSRALATLGPFAEQWAVAVATPELPPPPPVRPEPPAKGAADFAFAALKNADGGVLLSGDVPAEATRAFLGVIAGASSSSVLRVREGAPDGFAEDAVGGLRALVTMDSGRLVYKDYNWSFYGKSASETARAAAVAALGALRRGEGWSIDVVPPSPLEICTAEVAAFDERNAILFNAGSARITDASLPVIDEIAETLKACPSAVIQVEGHTDSDGDAESNLILSVARAEAVVDKLIELGIGYQRIYAIGYGESLPIASNDTNDGKRRNRRIVISVSDSTD